MGKLTKLNIKRGCQSILNKYDTMMDHQMGARYDREDINYWKNRIYYITLTVILGIGAPLILYGSYLFLKKGEPFLAFLEIGFYLSIVLLEFVRSVPIGFKKQCLILILYSISIFLLLTTGIYGGGLICVMFTLILSGCLLDIKQNMRFVISNIFVFLILSMLLYSGILDGTPLASDREIWLINVVTSQGCGIILLILTTVIYNGLEKQAQLIRLSQENLKRSEAMHKVMITNNSDAILIVDESGLVTYHSPNLFTILPWVSEKHLKLSLFDWFYPEDTLYLSGLFRYILMEDSSSKTMELRYLKNSEVGYIEMTAVNLLQDNSIKGILINCRDITERRLREEEIMYLYQHDPLTGLYNRASYEIELKRLDSKRYLPLSVIVGDINGLKLINDSLGHAEGDKLLLSMRDILISCCRKEDIVARLGGDEFTILLPNTDKEMALSIIQNIYQSCQNYNKSFDREIYQISISLGADTKAEINEPINNIIKTAEDYMYKRKLLERRSYHSSVIASAKTALFEKSYETERHARRLIRLTKAIGEAIGLTGQQFDELELLSTLHDIGKIGIDNQILNKPDILTEEEWTKMKKHSDIGYRIAMASPELMSIAYYILTHHERWDGSGYPQGLAGEKIPLLSRILAVADAYDAMMEDRPYRRCLSKEEALQEIIRNSGTQFDPKIARLLIDIIKEDRAKLDSEEGQE